MGLFDFLKSKTKTTVNSQSNSKDEILYDELKKKTERIRQENRDWKKAFDTSRVFTVKLAEPLQLSLSVFLCH